MSFVEGAVTGIVAVTEVSSISGSASATSGMVIGVWNTGAVGVTVAGSHTGSALARGVFAIGVLTNLACLSGLVSAGRDPSGHRTHAAGLTAGVSAVAAPEVTSCGGFIILGV